MPHEREFILTVMRRLLTNTFIVFAVASMLLNGIPLNFPGKVRVLRMARPIVVAAGFWQTWQMFAPLPDRRDPTFAAQVTFRGGSQSIFFLPRVGTMSPFQRIVHERYRKYEDDWLRNSPLLQADAARFIARAAAGPGRIPEDVRLIETDVVTDLPGHGCHLERGMLLDYHVRPQDIE